MMIKAVKKLKKLWTRKKRRKKTLQYQEPCYHHPSNCHCFYSYSTTSVQPSAPPLPPWLEPDHVQEATSVHQSSLESAYATQTLQEIVVETNPICPTLPPPYSYQQYLDPNPVYGVPAEVVQIHRRERSSGFWSCVVKFGANLIHCLCPCFRIREVTEIVA